VVRHLLAQSMSGDDAPTELLATRAVSHSASLPAISTCQGVMAQMATDALAEEAVMSVDEAANYLGVSRRTFERYLAARKITSIRTHTGRRVICVASLQDYLRRNTEVAFAQESGVA